MNITIIAIGRLKAGPERDLVARYLDRAAKAGRALAFDAGKVVELPESRAGQAEQRKREEAEAILSRVPAGASLVLLDERGAEMGSEAFAGWLAERRDGGLQSVAIVIGGADGLAPELAAKAEKSISFGRMTWPHQLVRIMLAEQIYRATTIVAGHPYHRA